MIVIVCPGQGSQTPGFLAPWLDAADAQEQLATISEVAGLDLIRHGTVSDAETIRDTAVAQPLIVAAGLVTLRALFTEADRSRVGGIAGHSVGELTAAAGASILSEADAVRLVAARGRAMAEAASIETTGMSAVLGGDEHAVLKKLSELELEPANFNGSGQIVAAGSLSALAALKESPVDGSRVIPLQVAGAFHTRYMRPAAKQLAPIAATLDTRNPNLTIWSNNDGNPVDSGARFLDLIVTQVSSPVRWDLVMSSFATAGVTGIIELAPAGTLTGLAKRALKGVPTVAVKTPDDLAAAHQLMETA